MRNKSDYHRSKTTRLLKKIMSFWSVLYDMGDWTTLRVMCDPLGLGYPQTSSIFQSHWKKKYPESLELRKVNSSRNAPWQIRLRPFLQRSKEEEAIIWCFLHFRKTFSHDFQNALNLEDLSEILGRSCDELATDIQILVEEGFLQSSNEGHWQLMGDPWERKEETDNDAPMAAPLNLTTVSLNLNDLVERLVEVRPDITNVQELFFLCTPQTLRCLKRDLWDVIRDNEEKIPWLEGL